MYLFTRSEHVEGHPHWFDRPQGGCYVAVAMESALNGLRVLDLSQGSAGPVAGMILSDNGAEVIRVEPPGGHGLAYEVGYMVWNRGKQSVELDLRADKGRDSFLRLADTADVVLESFRPGVTRSLGIDYETLSRRNPGLVYSTITGYGSTGPLANRPGYDALVQARLGFQTEQPRHSAAPSIHRDGPMIISVALPSMGAYMMAVYGTLAALYAREVHWRGPACRNFLGAGAPHQHEHALVEDGALPPSRRWLHGQRQEVPLPAHHL